MSPFRVALLLGMLALPGSVGAQPRLVLIDQDGSGPADSNQMSMMVLLQSPHVEVLGITVVTGNAWRDEQVDPTIITKVRELYMDVDLSHGPSYGHTLTWAAALKPATGVRLVHAQVDVDLPRFSKMFVDLMTAPTRVPRSR